MPWPSQYSDTGSSDESVVVATMTSPTRVAREVRATTRASMGCPAISSSTLPGSREDAMRAWMMAATSSDMLLFLGVVFRIVALDGILQVLDLAPVTDDGPAPADKGWEHQEHAHQDADTKR